MGCAPSRLHAREPLEHDEEVAAGNRGLYKLAAPIVAGAAASACNGPAAGDAAAASTAGRPVVPTPYTSTKLSDGKALRLAAVRSCGLEYGKPAQRFETITK